MKTPNPNDIVRTATELSANHNKLELVAIARGMGWRGDHARVPMLQIALFVATKLQAGDSEQTGTSRDSSASQQDGSQDSQQDGSQDSQQAEQEPWDDAEQSTDSDEYRSLLKASGIKLAHPMLEKVWRLATKAKRNVLLIGGAGCGKTMIGEQLAQLLRVPFSSISCTQGMSESDLTGTLLPIRAGGAFEYVPAPFVDCVQSQSVFLLDELNAADGNVLLIANSILANGFLTIPHKIGSPTIRKHPDSIIVAGLNEASDIYNSRGLLDGATLDRFYPVRIPYDVAYIKNKFVVDGKKGRARSPRWEPSAIKVDQVLLNDALAWFMNAFDMAQSGKLNRIVANRFADNLVAALKAGIPFDEVKADLTSDWTADERARIGS